MEQEEKKIEEKKEEIKVTLGNKWYEADLKDINHNEIDYNAEI